MPYYDNFSLTQPSTVGMKIADLAASNVLEKIFLAKAEITTILEIGPGRGAFYRNCDERLDYSCIDVSWPLLQGLENAKRICGLVPPLPIADEKFDVTFASNLLEHMVDFRAALLLVQEMARVTNTGGLICHRVPNVMAWGMHFWNGDYTHSFATTPRNVVQLYRDIGLEVVVVYPVSSFIVGRGAKIMSIIGNIIPTFLVNHGAEPFSKISRRLYSLKTSLLLGFLIIGQKR